MAEFSPVESVEDEKSDFAEWFPGLDDAPAARGVAKLGISARPPATPRTMPRDLVV